MTTTYLFQLLPAPGHPLDLASAIAALEAQRPLAHLPKRLWKLPLGTVSVEVPKGSDDSYILFRAPLGSPAALLQQAASELETIARELCGAARLDGMLVMLDLEEQRAQGFYRAEEALGLLGARYPLEHLPERVWRLDAGEVGVVPRTEEGRTSALEVQVPLSDRDPIVNECLFRASAAARASGLVLWDPQLNRAVADGDQGAVLEHFRRLAAYSGDLCGTPGLAGLTPPARMPAWARAVRWLFLAWFLAALIVHCLRRSG